MNTEFVWNLISKERGLSYMHMPLSDCNFLITIEADDHEFDTMHHANNLNTFHSMSTKFCFISMSLFRWSTIQKSDK